MEHYERIQNLGYSHHNRGVGLGFGGMEQPIRRYHDAIIPAVQKTFRDAKLGVNTTVNFIGPNDGGMGGWLKSRIEANRFDGSALTADFHDYYNLDGPLSFAQVRGKVCGTTAGPPASVR